MVVNTNTAAASAVSGNGRRGVAPPPGPSLRRHERRRRGLIAGGVVLVLAFTLGVGLLYSRAGGKVSVIVMARPVAAGHTIARADLATAQMASDSIPAYAASHLSEVIGKTAAVGLVTGEVLNNQMVSTQAATPPGDVLAGVALKAGQMPAGGVSAGDRVMVILLSAQPAGGSSAPPSAPTVLENSAQVTASQAQPDGSGTVVSLLIPKADAAALAQANNAGLVTVEQLPSS